MNQNVQELCCQFSSDKYQTVGYNKLIYSNLPCSFFTGVENHETYQTTELYGSGGASDVRRTGSSTAAGGGSDTPAFGTGADP